MCQQFKWEIKKAQKGNSCMNIMQIFLWVHIITAMMCTPGAGWGGMGLERYLSIENIIFNFPNNYAFLTHSLAHIRLWIEGKYFSIMMPFNGDSFFTHRILLIHSTCIDFWFHFNDRSSRVVIASRLESTEAFYFIENNKIEKSILEIIILMGFSNLDCWIIFYYVY